MTRMVTKEELSLLEGGENEEASTDNSDWVSNLLMVTTKRYLFRQKNTCSTQQTMLSLMVLKH